MDEVNGDKVARQNSKTVSELGMRKMNRREKASGGLTTKKKEPNGEGDVNPIIALSLPHLSLSYPLWLLGIACLSQSFVDSITAPFLFVSISARILVACVSKSQIG